MAKAIMRTPWLKSPTKAVKRRPDKPNIIRVTKVANKQASRIEAPISALASQSDTSQEETCWAPDHKVNPTEANNRVSIGIASSQGLPLASTVLEDSTTVAATKERKPTPYQATSTDKPKVTMA